MDSFNADRPGIPGVNVENVSSAQDYLSRYTHRRSEEDDSPPGPRGLVVSDGSMLFCDCDIVWYM